MVARRLDLYDKHTQLEVSGWEFLFSMTLFQHMFNATYFRH